MTPPPPDPLSRRQGAWPPEAESAPGQGAQPPTASGGRDEALQPLRDALLWMGRTASGRVAEAVRAVCERDVDLADRVVRRDSQIDIANDRLHHLAFSGLEEPGLGAEERKFLRAAVFVSQNLERIGDSAADIAKQARQLDDEPLDEEVSAHLRKALPVIEKGIQASLSACLKQRLDDARVAMEHEDRLDGLFREALGLVRSRPSSEDPARTVTAALLLKSVERIGDFIQNIAEQALFLLTGQRLKYGSLLELERLLGQVDPKAESLSYQNLFEGRSGARVARVTLEGHSPLFFKQDQPDKIGSELEKMRVWNELVPGTVPRARSQSLSGGGAAFLSEFLNSVLLRDLLLDQDQALIGKALRRLLATLEAAWTRSLRPEPPRVDYAAQIRERLGDIYAMHPGLRRARGQTVRLGSAAMPNLEETLDRVEALQGELAPPVSVWIHGDFNADNVFYDSVADRVYFVDVHRSGWGDYAQDASVFMVGNVRNPLLPQRVLRRMVAVNASVEGFARSFAASVGDERFEARMLLARGRSLITSARLMPDKRFARRLFLQGMHLLDKAAKEFRGKAPE